MASSVGAKRVNKGSGLSRSSRRLAHFNSVSKVVKLAEALTISPIVFFELSITPLMMWTIPLTAIQASRAINSLPFIKIRYITRQTDRPHLIIVFTLTFIYTRNKFVIV